MRDLFETFVEHAMKYGLLTAIRDALAALLLYIVTGGQLFNTPFVRRA